MEVTPPPNPSKQHRKAQKRRRTRKTREILPARAASKREIRCAVAVIPSAHLRVPYPAAPWVHGSSQGCWRSQAPSFRSIASSFLARECSRIPPWSHGHRRKTRRVRCLIPCLFCASHLHPLIQGQTKDQVPESQDAGAPTECMLVARRFGQQEGVSRNCFAAIPGSPSIGRVEEELQRGTVSHEALLPPAQDLEEVGR
jgi:hypothetical protein